MKLQQLEYVIAIAQDGSITKAAKRLYQAQPNISIALKELEESIGIQIFNRTPNGMILTPEGEVFLARARNVVEEIHSLENDYKDRVDGSLSFKAEVSRSAYATSIIGKTINNFIKDRGNINIHLSETDTLRVVEDVCTGKFDIGVTRIPASYINMIDDRISNRGVEKKVIVEYSMKLLMRADHPLAKYEDVPVEMLAEYPEIIHTDDEPDMLRRALINQDLDCDMNDKRIFIYDRGVQLSAISTIDNAYMWVTPIVYELYTPDTPLIVRDCSFARNTNMDILLYRKSNEDNPIIKACVDALLDFGKEATEMLKK